MFAGRFFGLWPAAVLAVALAMLPLLIGESSIGSIDHHFLEAPLTFAIVLTTCVSIRTADRRQAIVHGIRLGLVLIAALYVPTVPPARGDDCVRRLVRVFRRSGRGVRLRC